MEANQRMYREQRRDAMRDIGKFGERVIDTLMGSMLKQSSLRVDLAPNGGTGSIEDEIDGMTSSLVVVSDGGGARRREPKSLKNSHF